ncbi:hypothetical protein BRC81_06085 [Halobacteriales archaeon QS_1_68_20]|nr:MAG: hypothetical protein BRC81_06085 [Halobacteriales archaeon QS_1_68_20]
MNRRTLLHRIGAEGAATAGLAAPAETSAPGHGLEGKLDVAEVSGAVPLAPLIDGDLGAQLNEEYVEELPADLGPADLELEVGAATDVVALRECDDRCCGAASCREPGNCCVCIECP